jgi:hypothetical protein
MPPEADLFLIASFKLTHVLMADCDVDHVDPLLMYDHQIRFQGPH